MQAMGVKAVHVSVGFPVLTPAYYSDPSTAQQLTNFYGQVASGIHAMGLKLIVETGPVIQTDSNGNIVSNSYLSSLSMADYEAGRAQTAVTIAQVMQPDFLTVLNEPDTEASVSQQSAVNTLSGSAELLGAILQALQNANIQGVSVGAGIGSWLPNPGPWVTQIAGTPGVNYLDIHVFPVMGSTLTNLFTFAQQAQAAGKPLAMSQVWLYKTAPGDTAGYGAIHSRDAFSFWAPLDQQFIQALMTFSQSNNTVFVSPFWARYFRAYLNFSQYGGLTGSALENQVVATTTAAGAAGQIDSTGSAYALGIISPADTVPPTVPSGLSGVAANTSTVQLNWTDSTDNVGVLGYQIYRDGTPLATVANNRYLDTTATQTYHVYSVAAYDVSGNTSATSTGQFAPLDNTPPTAPATLQATAVSSTQVNLNWSASTDNLAVAQYQIYRGTSSTSLNLIAVQITATNWSDTQIIPGKTFYYAVRALDAAYNASGLSPVASVAVPADTTPPSVPSGVTAQANSSTSVTVAWNASTDNWKMGGYRIYRGLSPTSMKLVGGTSSTSYTDTTTKARTTYYYAVAAFDAFGNLSVKSTPVAVKTP